MRSSTANIEIQGHRGCRGLLPENSLPAIKKAIELGVHTLEMDVAISKDKKVVVTHEPFMSRHICLDPNKQRIPVEMDMKYNIFEMSHEEIKRFDCGSLKHSGFPEQILASCYKPLLSEVIEMAEKLNPKIKYNIELKSKPAWDGIFTPYPEEFVSLVIQEVENHNIQDRTNLQAFDVRILEQIKRKNTEIVLALLVDENENISQKLHSISFKPKILSPYFQLLTKDLVNRYQKLGYRVIPWTVNENEELQRMLDYQVDGIITDYPDRLLKLIV